MSTNYFGEGLGAKLGEFKLKYEAFAKRCEDQRKNSTLRDQGRTSRRSDYAEHCRCTGSIEVLESLGRSRVLSRIWVPPEQKEKGVYELTEILDAHHLFRALNGKIEGYRISLPQLETEANESGTLIRTDFEQLAPGNFRSPQLGRQTSLGGCRQTIRPVTA